MTLVVGILASVLYVRHSRATLSPILDLRLFDNPAPRIAILSGSIFRIGVGATPFLLPLMFQLAFGLDAFQSGLLTFASAIGAISLKFVATTALRAFGFRTVLLIAVIGGASLIAINGLFTPATPYAVIIGTLIVAGFLRSLFFTSNNALVFAEIDDSQASQATAIAAVSQQISIALGVAAAGMLLEAHHLWTGEPIGLAAFSFAFFAVGGLAALAILPILGLSRSAGRTVSGHGLAKHKDDQASLPGE